MSWYQLSDFSVYLLLCFSLHGFIPTSATFFKSALIFHYLVFFFFLVLLFIHEEVLKLLYAATSATSQYGHS